VFKTTYLRIGISQGMHQQHSLAIVHQMVLKYNVLKAAEALAPFSP
jgi:hypothetical protein